MPFCRKCGNQLEEQASFCPKCGTPMNEQATQPYTAQRKSSFPIVPIAVIVGVLFLAFALVILIVGQWSPFGTIVGSGNLVAQNQPFSDFTSVSVSSGFAFVITKSNSFSIKTITNDNIQSYIQISKLSGTLYVGLKPGYSIATSTLRVEISMPNLTRLELSGGSRGNAEGFVSANNFEIHASGGSTGQMHGQANDLTATASGGSQLHLSDFEVRNANVNLSGGSQAEINPSGRIDAELSGGSHLFYSDNPTLGNINASGGATIQRR
jgi:Putative auto-transporter adhesin, head GIN domain/zinc-ribbon domain